MDRRAKAVRPAFHGDHRQAVSGSAVVWLTSGGSADETQQPQMRSPSLATLNAPREVGSDLSGSEHKQEAPAAENMTRSSEGCSDRPSEPGLVRGYHVHSDAAWLSLSRGSHRLIQSQSASLAALQQHGC